VWGCSIWWRSDAMLTFRAVQVMLGVDRLDMIKGIPQKLLAFEKFLVR
jgi:trehalose-6-phosphate synthase